MSRKGPEGEPPWRAPVVCGAVAAVLYLATAARLPQFGDGLEFVAAAMSGGVAHPTGYPLFTTLLSIVPGGEGAYGRAAMVCALIGAGAAAAAAAICRRTMDLLVEDASSFIRTAAPYAVGLGAAFSASLWGQSTIIEVYGLNALLMAWALFLSLPRADGTVPLASVVGAGFLMGLCLGNHYTGLALLPIAALAASRTRWRGVPASGLGAFAAAGIAGASVLLLIPLRAAGLPPINWGDARTVSGFLWLVGGGDYGQWHFMQPEPGTRFTPAQWSSFAVRRLLMLGEALGSELIGGRATIAEGPGRYVLGIALLAAKLSACGLGIWLFARRRLPELLCLLFAGLGLVFLYTTYNIVDIEDYFLAFFVAFFPVFCAGFGEAGARAARWLEDRAPGASPVRLGIFAGLMLLVALGSNWRHADRSRDVLTAIWMERLLEAIPQDAVVLTLGDYDTYSLWYLQHAEGRRPDLLVVASNFLRSEWYASMLPPARPDPLDRRASVEPGDFRDFTQIDHTRMLQRSVIDPNLLDVPIATTIFDPQIIDLLQVEYRLSLEARLMTREEAEQLAARFPTIPPPVLYLVEPRLGRGVEGP